MHNIGSTALVALFDSARCQLAVANVGDSRGILCDAKGTVIPLSFDHKPQQVFYTFIISSSICFFKLCIFQF